MKPRAFSLIELVLVLAIIAVVGAIAAPRLSGASERQRLRAAGERLALDIARAREAVRAASGTCQFKFLRTGYAWQVDAAGAANASGAVELADAPYFVSVDSVDAGGDAAFALDGYGAPDSSLDVVLATPTYFVKFALPASGGPGVLNGPFRSR